LSHNTTSNSMQGS